MVLCLERMWMGVCLNIEAIATMGTLNRCNYFLGGSNFKIVLKLQENLCVQNMNTRYAMHFWFLLYEYVAFYAPVFCFVILLIK